ncbi:MAG: bifunctional glutamate N-acetyltransferase/amino-acid acetyltransferase ArgJ [Anaerovoracaceae bacterium]|jgi:glutamate N-acetyltransferase/amino-acid N-acetyltransferase
MEHIEGGVCAARGFTASGIHCGIKDNNSDKKDLALIVSEKMCSAAAVYTTNKVKGAPIAVTRRNIADGKAKAIICNSGNANTCAPNGEQIADETCELTAHELGMHSHDIIVASTGVIGEALSIVPFTNSIPELAAKLSSDGSADAASAIMTTDTIHKEDAVEFELGGKTCHIGGIAKGSGMIHPNMATMLSFITSDVDIEPGLLQSVLSEDVKGTFNQISVDGDTSTNDMVAVMANGMAGNERISDQGEALETFRKALNEVTTKLARTLASDGEGAGKLITCRVDRAETVQQARDISRSVISSNLLKAAIFGEDANWGRVLCAIGYTPGEFSADNIDVVMKSVNGSVTVCEGSRYKDHSEDEAAKVLQADEIEIDVNMNSGIASATAWGCDLTYDYVRINGDYRS